MTNKEEVEYWWRVEDITYAPTADEYGERRGPGTRDLHFQSFRVLKHTPKGVWVLRDAFFCVGDDFDDAPRSFVLKAQGGKRLCHPTKEDALVSYIARKERQARILEARLSSARAFKALAEAQLKGKVPGWPEGITRGELSDIQFGRS